MENENGVTKKKKKTKKKNKKKKQKKKKTDIYTYILFLNKSKFTSRALCFFFFLSFEKQPMFIDLFIYCNEKRSDKFKI